MENGGTEAMTPVAGPSVAAAPSSVPKVHEAELPVPPRVRAREGGLTTTDRPIGRSRDGATITVREFGSGAARVLLVGLIHGDEAEGYEQFDQLWEELRAEGVGSVATVRAIPNVNPDGHAARSRSNARGVDLNRNWPASNFSPSPSRGPHALSEPETRAALAELRAFDPHLIVVFHSASSGPFVDPDGPVDEAAEAFVSAARASDSRWRVHADYTNPPGSLGTYAGLDLGIPVLTVEFKRGQSAASARIAASLGLRACIDHLAAGGGQAPRNAAESLDRIDASIARHREAVSTSAPMP